MDLMDGNSSVMNIHEYLARFNHDRMDIYHPKLRIYEYVWRLKQEKMGIVHHTLEIYPDSWDNLVNQITNLPFGGGL